MRNIRKEVKRYRDRKELLDGADKSEVLIIDIRERDKEPRKIFKLTNGYTTEDLANLKTEMDKLPKGALIGISLTKKDGTVILDEEYIRNEKPFPWER